MIAKRSIRKTNSSFTKLAKYITGKSDQVQVTNCGFDDINDLGFTLKEIESTQASNTRSKSDKTYHLIISFRPEDELTTEQLAAIEDEFVQGLGYGEHQRISAVHTDTDHLHVHLAINKIHPETLRIHEPYYDKYRLNDLCAEIEQVHGLAKDNRIDKSATLPTRSDERELQTGEKSFQRWCREQVVDPTKQFLQGRQPTWQGLVNLLSTKSVIIKPKNNGLVFVDGQGNYQIKASAVDPDFSKPKLVAVLGEMPSDLGKGGLSEGKDAYRPEPIHKESNGLYAAFLAEKNAVLKAKQAARELLRKSQETRYEELRAGFQQKRQEIKADNLMHGTMKFGLYQRLSIERQKALAGLKAECAAERKAVTETYKTTNWQDYLISKAMQGDAAALTALRKGKRKSLANSNNNRISGSVAEVVFAQLESSVRANGDVVYKRGIAKMRDSEKQIDIEHGAEDLYGDAFALAQKKFTGPLRLGGTDTFISGAIKYAADKGLSVEFEKEEHQKVFAALSEKSSEPVQLFLKERNQRARIQSNVPEHRLFTKNDAGPLVYAGQRTLLDGSKLALYDKLSVRLAKPISGKQAAQLRSIKVGTEINVDVRGFVRKEGITR